MVLENTQCTLCMTKLKIKYLKRLPLRKKSTMGIQGNIAASKLHSVYCHRVCGHLCDSGHFTVFKTSGTSDIYQK